MSYSFQLKELAEHERRPPRLTVLAGPKVGKTTFGCSAPDPVLMCLDAGAEDVTGVKRMPDAGQFESWEHFIAGLNFLLNTEHDRKWIVIDTLNGAEALLTKKILKEQFGDDQKKFMSYGAGATIVGQEVEEMFVLLSKIREQKNMGIILLAHVGLTRAGNLFGDDYHKFIGDVNKNTWRRTHAWSDQIAFAHFETAVRDDEVSGKKKARALNEDRWLTFKGGPGLDAGTRAGYEVEGKIKFTWDDYVKAQKPNASKSK